MELSGVIANASKADLTKHLEVFILQSHLEEVQKMRRRFKPEMGVAKTDWGVCHSKDWTPVQELAGEVIAWFGVLVE